MEYIMELNRNCQRLKTHSAKFEKRKKFDFPKASYHLQDKLRSTLLQKQIKFFEGIHHKAMNFCIYVFGHISVI